jgi:cytochrome P450
VLGDGLLTSEGNLHNSQRQIIQPAFNQNQLTVYADIMTEYILRMSNSWMDNDTLDVHKEFTQLTLAILCKTLFGFDIEPEAEEIGKHVTTLVEYFNRARMPLAGITGKLPLPSNRRFRCAKEQVEAIIYRIIYDHKSTSNVNRTSSLAAGNHQADLISLLLTSNNIISGDRNYNHSNSYLRDNVITIFLAGHETVANALTWTFYLLSQNSKEEHKLHEEVDSVLGRDSRFFLDPERFNPDRWTNEKNTDLPRFSYFPFGGGPRMCIGEPFAWTEGILAVAMIARKWKMELESGHPVALKPLVTLRPKYGMRMKLIRRRSK